MGTAARGAGVLERRIGTEWERVIGIKIAGISSFAFGRMPLIFMH
jgi:hypothetical protein